MKKLIIFKNNLGDEGVGIITSAVQGKEISLCGAEPGQTELDLSKQGRGLDDAKIIAWELSAGFVSSSMKKLNVLSNAIGAEGAQVLIDAAPQQLQTFCSMEEGQTEVDLSGKFHDKYGRIGIALGPGDAILLAWELITGYVSSSMNKLNVLSNSIGDEGYEILTRVAEEKGILTLVGFAKGQTEADLSNKRLGPIDAKLIARELTTGFVSTSMTSLNISDNYLTGSNADDMTGIKAIADALHVSSSMTSLNVAGNSLGPEGAKILAEMLRVSTSLTSLNVSGNNLNDEARSMLANAAEARNVEVLF